MKNIRESVMYILIIILMTIVIAIVFFYYKDLPSQKNEPSDIESDTSTQILKNLFVCGKTFQTSPIYIDGLDVELTKRIANLADREFATNPNKNSSLCSAYNNFPNGYELKTSASRRYNTENKIYNIYFLYPFVVDIPKNLIYHVNEMDDSIGSVFGKIIEGNISQ